MRVAACHGRPERGCAEPVGLSLATRLSNRSPRRAKCWLDSITGDKAERRMSLENVTCGWRNRESPKTLGISVEMKRWRRGWDSSEARPENSMNPADFSARHVVPTISPAAIVPCLRPFARIRAFCQRDVTQNVTRASRVRESWRASETSSASRVLFVRRGTSRTPTVANGSLGPWKTMGCSFSFEHAPAESRASQTVCNKEQAQLS